MAQLVTQADVLRTPLTLNLLALIVMSTQKSPTFIRLFVVNWLLLGIGSFLCWHLFRGEFPYWANWSDPDSVRLTFVATSLVLLGVMLFTLIPSFFSTLYLVRKLRANQSPKQAG